MFRTRTLLLLIGCTAILSGARSSLPVHASSEASRAGYVGDEACVACHWEESLSYKSTAHHLTSQLPGSTTILGASNYGKDGSNILLIADPAASSDDPRLFFRMDVKDGRFFETAVAEKGTQHLAHSEPIDIVIGSGVRGQTYLYWSSDQLYELPVSYWTDGHQWINSPGYRDGTANFSRHVDPRCLECHATYIQALSTDPQTNRFDKTSLTPGIACELCHGPGATHITLEKNNPGRRVLPSAGILNPARFERDRQIDQCALCHNGTQGIELQPAFSYLAGEPLTKYISPAPLDPAAQAEVHGNQVGLLERSRCYLNSPAMSCSTCHNVHAPERAAASYSARCLSCHQWQSCGLSKTLGAKIKQNCIDCHMPVQQTNAIVCVTAGKEVRAKIRTHWIKVYPEFRGSVE
jgi:hypothetical protein